MKKMCVSKGVIQINGQLITYQGAGKTPLEAYKMAESQKRHIIASFYQQPRSNEQ